MTEARETFIKRSQDIQLIISRFYNLITQQKRSDVPQESRGGILADEMGMGKSLMVIALIMHTQELAHSFTSMHQDPIGTEVQRATSEGSTLIITPKSSELSSSSYLSTI